MEDETERMRAELLKKEKELIELKQRELDLEIARYKKQQSDQVTFPNLTVSSCHSMMSSDAYKYEINILLANVLIQEKE